MSEHRDELPHDPDDFTESKRPTTYREFNIWCDPPGHPCRSHDWTYAHDGYDGPGDNRHGTAPSYEACCAEIDDYWEDQS